MILESALILSLANSCQDVVRTEDVKRLIDIESSGNPYAIAVKGVPIVKQPQTKDEAISAAKQLDSLGFNYSVGLMQVNHTNFERTGLTIETAFDACKNIKAGSSIFADCFYRAKNKFKDDDSKNRERAASCYYSGNFTYGFKKEKGQKLSYVEKFSRTNSSSEKKAVIENETQTDKKLNYQDWDVFNDFGK